MKKAQGLSMNVIIIAAISLLVLVILAVLLFKSAGTIDDGTGCTGVQGRCVEGGNTFGNICEEEIDPGWMVDNSHKCENDGEVCCISI